MTIFMKILLEVLQEKMNEGLKKSIQADGGYGNYTLGLFGLGRDSKVSSQKQKILRDYLYLLSNLTMIKEDPVSLPEESRLPPIERSHIKLSNSFALAILNNTVDEDTQAIAQTIYSEPYTDHLKRLAFDYLNQPITDDLISRAMSVLINNCQLEVKHQGKEAGFEQTSIGLALKDCRDYIEKLKDALEASKLLLNMPYDDDPYHQFAWQMGRYLWHAALIDNDLAVERKKLVLRALTDCKNDLIDLHHDKMTSSYKKTVIDHIQQLRRANQSLCEQQGFPLDVPVSLTVLATINLRGNVFIPSVGELDACALLAMKAIERVSHEPANHFASSSSSSFSPEFRQ